MTWIVSGIRCEAPLNSRWIESWFEMDEFKKEPPQKIKKLHVFLFISMKFISLAKIEFERKISMD